MRHIILIACCKRKAKEKMPASMLYQGDLFCKSLAYAKGIHPDSIYILSAKYGLVGPEDEIEPYDMTLNSMRISKRREWSNGVLGRLSQIADLQQDKFTILAGKRYRERLIPHLPYVDIPLEGLGIGKQLQWLKDRVQMSEPCALVHNWFSTAARLRFPFDGKQLPKNGIYILFEKGETGHGGDRIVRVGTHTGTNQLPSRLEQHFIKKNKDRSIFRKNIGRCLLNANDDPYLAVWNLDMTTRKGREANGRLLDRPKQDSLEDDVLAYIQSNLSFAVIEVASKEDRLDLESKLISTVSLCEECRPSSDWLGLQSPKQKIRESGLWLVNELYKKPLSTPDLERLRQLLNVRG